MYHCLYECISDVLNYLLGSKVLRQKKSKKRDKKLKEKLTSKVSQKTAGKDTRCTHFDSLTNHKFTHTCSYSVVLMEKRVLIQDYSLGFWIERKEVYLYCVDAFRTRKSTIDDLSLVKQKFAIV